MRPNDIDAWMIAFGGPPNATPTIALSVVVLDEAGTAAESTGAQVAGPIAKQILQAYLTGH